MPAGHRTMPAGSGARSLLLPDRYRLRWRRCASRIAHFCRGRDLALLYACAVVGTTAVLALLPASVHDEVILRCSTNLNNLRQHPLAVLVASAFVLGSPAELAEVPLLIWAYGALQRWLGRAATVVTGVFGHVGATLFVAVVLVSGITRNLISPAVGYSADVGVSYGMAAVAGLCAIRVPGRWRSLYLGVLIGVLGTALVVFHTFTSLGHVTAFCIGVGLAALVSAARRSPGRSALPRTRPVDLDG